MLREKEPCWDILIQGKCKEVGFFQIDNMDYGVLIF
jgi:hypothetical protein